MIQKIPKLSFSSLSQILFVFKETFKIAWTVRPKLLTATLLLGALWGLSNLPILYLEKAIIDTALSGITRSDKTEIIKLIVALIIVRSGIELFRITSHKFQRRLHTSLNYAVDAKVQVLLSEKMSSLDLLTLEDASFKNKYDRIYRESSNRVWNLINILAQIPNDILGLLTSMAPLFLFSPLLIFFLIILTLPAFVVDSKLVRLDYELDKTMSAKNLLRGWLSYLLLIVRNYMEPRLLGNSKYLINRFESLTIETFSAREKLRLKKAQASSLADLPSWIFTTAFRAWLFVQVVLGSMTLGTVQLLYRASDSFQNYLQNLSENLIEIYENYLYMVDLVWFLNLSSQAKPGKVVPAKIFTKGIEFRDVWFHYPKTKRFILKGINLTIHPGEKVAMVGENGAGKTTLIKLLGRFYEPQKGEILVNGRNIFDYKEQDYWKKLSVLFQDFERYPFSARESIGYGQVDRMNRMDEIISAASETGIHSYIDSLEQKYETPLAKDFEGGIEPSGGQWQRIALARALFRYGEIIILDEPTSNVDPKAEEEIFKKVMSLAKGKILILISHRFSTVRRADKIFVIEKGRVEEEGKHEDLMKKDGLYAKLFNLQAKGYL